VHGSSWCSVAHATEGYRQELSFQPPHPSTAAPSAATPPPSPEPDAATAPGLHTTVVVFAPRKQPTKSPKEPTYTSPSSASFPE